MLYDSNGNEILDHNFRFQNFSNSSHFLIPSAQEHAKNDIRLVQNHEQKTRACEAGQLVTLDHFYDQKTDASYGTSLKKNTTYLYLFH